VLGLRRRTAIAVSRYAGAAYEPLSDHDGGPMRAHLGLVLHVAEGNGSLRRYFQGTKHPHRKSSTFWCGKDGRVEQYLDSSLIAWAEAGGNSTYNSVETEGFASAALTDAQVEALGKLYTWGHDLYGWPYEAVDTPGQRGFILHSDGGAAWGGHHCPGKLRGAQRSRILELARTGTDPGSSHPAEPTYRPEPKRGLLREYERGPRVKAVQSKLGVSADGYFGPDTLAAVKSFQRKHHLAVDGIVGPKTRAALNRNTKPKGQPKTKPPAKPKTRKASRFPLPAGSYFGPKSAPTQSVSGYYSHRSDLRRWQARMAKRGWSIDADGLYGPQTKKVCRAFQKEKGLAVDGKIGPVTWAAAWTKPVT
jgi:peptidoglycan hydrolase-like protein with peptidoglycan-binding domain